MINLCSSLFSSTMMAVVELALVVMRLLTGVHIIHLLTSS